MNKKVLIDTLGWGFVLWLLGYGLGILLFTIVPASLIGWIITPIGTLITLYVLFKKNIRFFQSLFINISLLDRYSHRF